MVRGVLSLLIAALAFSNSRADETDVKIEGLSQQASPDSQKLSDSILNLGPSNSMFAFRLYREIVSQPEHQGKNVFFSPFSLSVALAAVTLGARGNTHDELYRGLGFNLSHVTEEGVHDGFQTILESLNLGKGVDQRAGSALFVGDSFKAKNEFLEGLKKYYLSDTIATDFKKSREATKAINDYVKKKTRGKIRSLVEQLDPTTVMYLVSYIYFKGKWAVPFPPERTKDQLFKVNETTSVTVKMMSKKHDYNIYHDQEISTTVLQLFYTPDVSMMLLLPDEHDIKAIEGVVTPEHVAKWNRWMRKREALVSIPKLAIETSYSLKNVLSGMGMSNMFGYSANFSGIADEPIFISEVVQKATLDVDETGSTASAAGGVAFTPLSFRPFETITFDRPFMVLVSNHNTQSILFLGKIVNPAEN